MCGRNNSEKKLLFSMKQSRSPPYGQLRGCAVTFLTPTISWEGFEPPTASFQSPRSTKLSYQEKCHTGVEPVPAGWKPDMLPLNTSGTASPAFNAAERGASAGRPGWSRNSTYLPLESAL